MKVYYFEAEQFLPIEIYKAWEFFSSPKNLQVITPPNLNFRIVTSLENGEISNGMIIDYTLQPLFSIPVNWKSEIYNVDKPFRFSDKQLKGPYRLWEHHHSFIEQDGGTMMKDQIHYVLPLGLAGRLAHSIVRKRIQTVFDYRREILGQLFKS